MIGRSPTEERQPTAGAPGDPGPPLVLASASPRRRELLRALGAHFTTIATDAEEHDLPTPAPVAAVLPPLALPPGNHPTLLAWRKAHAAAAQAPGAVVLGADTVVVIDGTVLNKPADAAEAMAMLGRLSGRTHTVYTGLCVIRAANGADPAPASARYGEQTIWLELVAAEVAFHPLEPAQIAAYVATGEPLDKAGAYGLQGLGGAMVRAVHGSYTAVVGLPLPEVHRLLSAAGVGGLGDPAVTYQRWLQSQGKEPLPCPPTRP